MKHAFIEARRTKTRHNAHARIRIISDGLHFYMAPKDEEGDAGPAPIHRANRNCEKPLARRIVHANGCCFSKGVISVVEKEH